MARDQCTVIIGRHEGNVVLKDNDLHIKISLQMDEAKDVLEILKKDSDLLGKLGVLDYRWGDCTLIVIFIIIVAVTAKGQIF